jgi:hypothetical protein
MPTAPSRSADRRAWARTVAGGCVSTWPSYPTAELTSLTTSTICSQRMRGIEHVRPLHRPGGNRVLGRAIPALAGDPGLHSWVCSPDLAPLGAVVLGRIQGNVATNRQRMRVARVAAGLLQFSALRGRPFSSLATASRSSRVWTERSVPFGKYLVEQPVGFLVRGALPWTSRFAEEDRHTGCRCQLMVLGHLDPLVPRQRPAQLDGEAVEHLDQSLA